MADRDAAVWSAAEDVLRVAEPRPRKPVGSRHLARGENALVRLARVDLEELPDRRPEVLELVHRPLPHVAVVPERQAARLVEPFAVARDRRRGDPLRARRPDDRRRLLRHAGDATHEEAVTDRARKRAVPATGLAWLGGAVALPPRRRDGLRAVAATERASAAGGLERRRRLAVGVGDPGKHVADRLDRAVARLPAQLFARSGRVHDRDAEAHVEPA